MNGDGVGELELVEVDGFIGDVAVAFKSDVDGDGIKIDAEDVADVAVEGFFFVVVAGLDDFVADAEELVAAFDFEFHFVRRVEGVLKKLVETAGAEFVDVHGGEDLDVADGIEGVFGGEAVVAEVEDGLLEGEGIGFFEEEEVAVGAGFEVGEFALVDGVGGGDDAALRCLAEDFAEVDGGDFLAGDEILKDGAGSDGGELVGVADDEEMGAGGDGAEVLGHEGGVDHGGFVEDEEVAFEGSAVVVAPDAVALEFEEAVHGGGVVTGAGGEALGGASGGGGEDGFDVFRREDGEDAVDDGGFADAGAAGDDEDALGEGGADGVLLAGGELDFGGLGAPLKGGVDVDGGIAGGAAEEVLEVFGDADLALQGGGEVDEVAFFDGVADEGVVGEELVELGLEFGWGDGEEFFGVADEEVAREAVVAVGGGGFEGVEEAGAEALGGGFFDAHVGGDVVGGFEADAVDVVGELVGVGLEDFEGLVAVGAVDALGAGGADAALVEEDHDVVHGFLFHPGGADFLTAFFADAFNFLEAGGFVFDDVEDGGAEFFDDAFGVFGSDAVDEAAAEVTFEALEGVGLAEMDGGGLELAAVFGVVDPFAAGFDFFAGDDAWDVAGDGDEVAAAGGLDFEDGVAVFFVVVGDALDDAAEGGVGLGCGSGPGSHGISKRVLRGGDKWDGWQDVVLAQFPG